jgi:menaquinone-dependent protoporphyrinogen oxidase
MSRRRILIVYASHYGQTAKVAHFIADQLRQAGDMVTLSRVEDFRGSIAPGQFNGAIIGASINFGKHQRSIGRFVRENREELGRMPSAFLSVSGAACSPHELPRAAAQQYIANFLRETGWHPTFTESIAGAMPYTKYSPFVRWMIGRISRKEGGPTDTSKDYEFTDWAQVRRCTERFVAELPLEERPTASAAG